MDEPTLQLSAEEIFDLTASRRILESEVLPGYIVARRWFGGKARSPRRFEIIEMIPLEEATSTLALIRVGYLDGSSETYSLPLAVAPMSETGEAAIASLSDNRLLVDATQRPSYRAALMRLIARSECKSGTGGSLAGIPGKALEAGAEAFTSRVLTVEQSNSSMIYTAPTGADRVFVKLFRKLEEGMNPDVEITRHLSEKAGFTHVPPFAGALEYRRNGAAESQVVALAQGMVPNDGDAWAFTLREVADYYAAVRKHGISAPEFVVPRLLEPGDTPDALMELLGVYAARAWQLGMRTGQLHLALATESDEPAFAPEPLTSADLHELAEEIHASAQRAWGLLSAPASKAVVPPHFLADSQGAEREIGRRADALAGASIQATKTRIHGDYHLGQVLDTGDDFVIIDFEGEPLRPLAERKAKRSPLRDVAGMLRSFHYAAHSGLAEFPESTAALLPWAEAWALAVSRTFLQGWRMTVADASFVPASSDEFQMLLEAFLLEKALYEVAYELNNRPNWVGIPLRGINSVLGIAP